MESADAAGEPVPLAALQSGSRILVTGARGFIGGHLVKALVSQGLAVHGTSRVHVPSYADMTWWHCDPSDLGQIRNVFAQAKPDIVFHLSSLADGRTGRNLVLPTFRSETVAAVNVLTAAAEFGVHRLLLPGSLEEPDGAEAPASPYAAAKASSSLYARMFSSLYGTPVVQVRIFMAYGPGQPEWKLIPSVASCLLRGECPAIASPERRLDWVYISDVAQGLIAAAATPGLEGRVVDLGSGQLTSIREIVERLQALAATGAHARFGTGGDVRGRATPRVANVAATLRETGWAPKVSLDIGLAEVVAALQHPT